jgi:galactokinase
MADLDALKRAFLDRFGGGGAGIRAFHAPGRVNLIGEHTDYNGGCVFPAALTFGTTMLIRPRGDRKLALASENMPKAGVFDLDGLAHDPADDWMNYPKGVVVHLAKHGFPLSRGYDILYCGEIPSGSGLSSSASIEVVTGYGLLRMEGHDAVDTVRLAQIAQEAENRYVGVNCGIMDQFAVANGRKNHAILLRCDTLEHRLVPLDTGGCKLVITHTNKRRGLADTAYNERRAQCEKAVAFLRTAFPDLKLLGELSPRQLDDHARLIPDATVLKRARHVIEENRRVLEAVKALEANDLAAFGRLMVDSHRSLQHLYEVTGPELDALVDAALDVDGVLGSRMTGAGFGGCTVSLVREDRVEAFRRRVGDVYTKKTGLVPTFYVCGIGDGVKEVE